MKYVYFLSLFLLFLGTSLYSKPKCPLNKLVMSPAAGGSLKTFTVQRYAKKSKLRCFNYKVKIEKSLTQNKRIYFNYDTRPDYKTLLPYLSGVIDTEYGGKSNYKDTVYDYDFPLTKLDRKNFACQTLAYDEVFEGLLEPPLPSTYDNKDFVTRLRQGIFPPPTLIYLHVEFNSAADPIIKENSYTEKNFNNKKLKNLVWVSEENLLGTEIKIGDLKQVYHFTNEEIKGPLAGPLDFPIYEIIGCRK